MSETETPAERSGENLVSPSTGGGKAVPIFLLIIAAAQIIILLRVMPVGMWLDHSPIIDRDYAFNFGNAYALTECMRVGKHAWGYDPFWFAGYPIGVLIDVDNMGASLFCFAFSWLSLARAFKLFVFIAYLLIPLMAYPTARCMGLGRGESAVATALVFLAWNTYEEMVNYQAFGMFSFLFSAAGGALVFACYTRFERNTTARAFLPLVALALLYFPIHILGVLHAGLPMIPYFLLRGRANRKFLLGSLLLAGLILVLNLYWVGPVVHFLRWVVDASHHLQSDVTDLGKDFVSPTWFSYITIFGLAGLYLWAKEDKKKPLAASLLVVALIYLTFSYLGSILGSIKGLQPKRFKVPLSFLLAPPAGLAILRLGRLYVAVIRRKATSTEARLALMLAVPVLVLMARPGHRDLIDFVIREPYTITTAVYQETADLATWIKTNTGEHDRILLEDTERKGRTRYEVRDNARPLLHWLTGRAFVGRYDPPGVMRHTETNFLDGVLFGYPIESYVEKQFEELAQRYDFRWVMAFDERSIKAFSEFAYLEEVDQVGQFRIWRNTTPRTIRIEARFNEIIVSNAPTGQTLLPFHWCDGLAVEPPLPIMPKSQKPDPVPLIQVDNGDTRTFRVYMAYGRAFRR